MYDDLLSIKIELTDQGHATKIIVDKKQNIVSCDDKNRVETKQNVEKFLDYFFRILRQRISDPQKIEAYANNGYQLKIRIVEKENKFDYIVKGNILNEFDDFYNVIKWLKK